MEEPATGLYVFSVQIAMFGVALATWRNFIPGVNDGHKGYPDWYRNVTRLHRLGWCNLPLLLMFAVCAVFVFCTGITLLVLDEVTGFHRFAVLFGMFGVLSAITAVLVQRYREGHRTVPTSHRNWIVLSSAIVAGALLCLCAVCIDLAMNDELGVSHLFALLLCTSGFLFVALAKLFFCFRNGHRSVPE